MPRRRRRKGSWKLWNLVWLVASAGLIILIFQSNPTVFVGLLVLVAAVVAVVLYMRRPRRTVERLPLRSLGDLLMLSPSQFEDAMVGLLTDRGYRDVTRTGGSGDLGADIVCRDDRGSRVVVQCKRHAPGIHVGTPVVQSFIGMMHVHHQADRGIVITTSSFTAPAIQLAQQYGIELIDGVELSHIFQ